MTDIQRKEAGIDALPGSLREAAEEFAKDAYIREVMGEDLAEKYIRAKKKEYMDYCTQITEWEIGRYLHRI